jgi:hypothetical protein
VRSEVGNAGYPRYGPSSLRLTWGILERFFQARPAQESEFTQSAVQAAGCGTWFGQGRREKCLTSVWARLISEQLIAPIARLGSCEKSLRRCSAS